MTMDEISDLQIGKAGEYLVCADLILNGYVAFPSEQGLPFDVVFDYKGRLLKVQVKTTRNYRDRLQRTSPIPSYTFNIGSNGRLNRRKKYETSQVDIFALVVLDTRAIAYLPYFSHHTTLSFRVPELRGTYLNEQARNLQEKIILLTNEGKSTSEIGKLLDLSTNKIYKSLNYNFKDNKLGVYFDDFTLDKCLANFG